MKWFYLFIDNLFVLFYSIKLISHLPAASIYDTICSVVNFVLHDTSFTPFFFSCFFSNFISSFSWMLYLCFSSLDILSFTLALLLCSLMRGSFSLVILLGEIAFGSQTFPFFFAYNFAFSKCYYLPFSSIVPRIS